MTRAEMKDVMGGVEDEGNDYKFALPEDAGSGYDLAGPYPKIDACEGKPVGTPCVWTYRGKPSHGYCRQFFGNPIHCSNTI